MKQDDIVLCEKYIATITNATTKLPTITSPIDIKAYTEKKTLGLMIASWPTFVTANVKMPKDIATRTNVKQMMHL